MLIRKKCIELGALVLWVAVAPSVSGRVLDDFSQGPLNIAAGAEVVEVESLSLDPTRTVGGSRHTSAYGFVIARVDVSLTPPRASFPQGILALGLPAFGEFRYGVNSPLNIDLTADGAREFRISIGGNNRHAYLENAILTVNWMTDTGTALSQSHPFSSAIDLGEMTIGRLPFSHFDALTNVSEIALRFNGISPSGSPLLTVMNFVTTVPEPSSIGWVSAVLLMCLLPGTRCVRRSRLTHGLMVASGR